MNVSKMKTEVGRHHSSTATNSGAMVEADPTVRERAQHFSVDGSTVSLLEILAALLGNLPLNTRLPDRPPVLEICSVEALSGALKKAEALGGEKEVNVRRGAGDDEPQL
ncbi:unnamed protein product [Heligmosomoides polygyrus]|uniref:Skp1_POZ domain-containing protein n=1 Tax=Heligmosomoides polygyrus TaxID=6339 RepID=A0A183F1S6_HELPZ|nr:unnamed protein product [Heligmosomoides polygyrus]